MKYTTERHHAEEDFSTAAQYYMHLMHLATYQFASRYTAGKKVLDYGCGTGYGSKLIAQNALRVTAADISDEALEYAAKHHSETNLEYISTEKINPDERFDVVTSFQVIEHVFNDKKYLKTVFDFLNPGGVLLISTPDKSNRLFRIIQKPWNIYHVKEYDKSGLTSLIKKYFSNYDVMKVTSKYDLVRHEISRRKKQRLLTLPVTLFFYPYRLRVILLNFEKWLFEGIIKLRNHKPQINSHGQGVKEFMKYTVDDIEITHDTLYPTDLLAICIKN